MNIKWALGFQKSHLPVLYFDKKDLVCDTGMYKIILKRTLLYQWGGNSFGSGLNARE